VFFFVEDGKTARRTRRYQGLDSTYPHMKQILTYLVVAAFLAGTTPSSMACDFPHGLSAGSITATSAVLSWSPVTGANDYNVAWQKVNSGFWHIVANVKQTSITIGGYPVGLSPNTTYRFMVQTVCSSGFSPYSTPVSFKTASK
jgi:hypothetical protein